MFPVMLNSLFRIYQYPTLTARTHARITAALSLLSFGLLLVADFVFPLWTFNDLPQRITLWQAAQQSSLYLPILFVPLGLSVLALGLVREGRLLSGSYIGVAVGVGISVMSVLLLPGLDFSNSLYVLGLVITMLLAFLMTNTLGGLATTLVCILALVADPGSLSARQIISYAVVLTIIAGIALVFLQLSQFSLREGIISAEYKQTALITVSHNLARLTIMQHDLNDAVREGLHLLHQSFPEITSAALYLIDDDSIYLTRAHYTGRATDSYPERVAVGSASVMGQVALDGTRRSVVPDNPLNESQRVLPITQAETIIGVLVITSVVFTESDGVVYQSMADGLALVIYSVRQYQSIANRADESTRLTEQARNALAEVQRLDKRLIGRAWTDYMQDNTQLNGLEYDAASRQTIPVDEWSELSSRAMDEARIIVQGTTAAIPLRVRGQLIGALEIDLPAEGSLNADMLAMLEEMSDRFGLAAENVRLLEQSQRNVQRESLINRISTRIQATTNVEATLAETARTLHELLLAEQVVIRLGKPERIQPNHVMEESA